MKKVASLLAVLFFTAQLAFASYQWSLPDYNIAATFPDSNLSVSDLGNGMLQYTYMNRVQHYALAVQISTEANVTPGTPSPDDWTDVETLIGREINGSLTACARGSYEGLPADQCDVSMVSNGKPLDGVIMLVVHNQSLVAIYGLELKDGGQRDVIVNFLRSLRFTDINSDTKTA